jgi:hypothetical protein
MPGKTNRILFLIIALTVVCCCLPASLACGAGAFATAFALIPPPAATNPQAMASEMDRIEADVQAVTGITPTHSVPRSLMTRSDLAAKMKSNFEKSYSPEEARAEANAYSVFDLMDANVDLYQVYLQMYSTSIAGFFDPDTGNIYVISDAGFGPEQRMTYAHEYMHALQFQHYDMNALGENDEVAQTDPERYLGLQALMEGEASFVSDTWVDQHFTPFDRWFSFREEFIGSLSDDTLFSTPAPLWVFLYFPYDQGKSFAETIYREGGWGAMEKVFQHPPVSSEMILHPERYAAEDMPVHLAKPVLPASVDPDLWAEQDDSTWGEFGIRVILDLHHISNEDQDTAATGWGGDRYVVWRNSQNGQLLGLWHTTWDTSKDADEFNRIFMAWNDTAESSGSELNSLFCRISPPYATCMRWNGKDIWWAYAPSTAEARMLLEANVAS